MILLTLVTNVLKYCYDLTIFCRGDIMQKIARIHCEFNKSFVDVQCRTIKAPLSGKEKILSRCFSSNTYTYKECRCKEGNVHPKELQDLENELN